MPRETAGSESAANYGRRRRAAASCATTSQASLREAFSSSIDITTFHYQPHFQHSKADYDYEDANQSDLHHLHSGLHIYVGVTHFPHLQSHCMRRRYICFTFPTTRRGCPGAFSSTSQLFSTYQLEHLRALQNFSPYIPTEIWPWEPGVFLEH
jgi:hypothetical protein